MKKFLLLLTSGLFVASFTVTVWAEEGCGNAAMGSGKGMMGMEKMEMRKHMMMGSHKMVGTVDGIDYAKGMLTLKSGAPDMRLHFPADAIKDLKNGDTITVDLGFTREDKAKKDKTKEEAY